MTEEISTTTTKQSVVYEGRTYLLLPADAQKIQALIQKASKRRVKRAREYTDEEKAKITERMNQLREIRKAKRAQSGPLATVPETTE